MNVADDGRRGSTVSWRVSTANIYLLGRKNNLPINIDSAIFHGDYSDTIYRMGCEMCPIHLLNSWWVAFDDATPSDVNFINPYKINANSGRPFSTAGEFQFRVNFFSATSVPARKIEKRTTTNDNYPPIFETRLRTSLQKPYDRGLTGTRIPRTS